jgi:hypothetical protein
MKTIKTMINATASRWRNRVPPREKRGAGTNEVCPYCGAQFTPSRLSLREMILAAICGSLLLLILVPAGWMSDTSLSGDLSQSHCSKTAMMHGLHSRSYDLVAK